jgi:hypothetical protein
VGISMCATSYLTFHKSKFEQVEKAAREFFATIIQNADTATLYELLREYQFILHPVEDGRYDTYILEWEGEKYGEHIQRLLEALAKFFDEGSYMEGIIEADDRFKWQVISSKLVDMRLAEVWYEPGKAPVCPECGTSLDIAKE